MSDLQGLLIALGVPAILGFPVWVARLLLLDLKKELKEQTRLLTVLVDRMGGDTRSRRDDERRDAA